jgi:hypothetical protein
MGTYSVGKSLVGRKKILESLSFDFLILRTSL